MNNFQKKTAISPAIIRLVLLCFFTLFFANGSTAQHTSKDPFFYFRPTQANGLIPKEFVSHVREKYEQDRLKVEIKNQEDLALKDKFFLESSYLLNEMLLSGKIIFNDTIGNYLSKVKNVLLKEYPELNNQLRIYAIKSDVANAFAMGNGALFVNIGLLPYLQNEAELAFIIGHEIAHYYKTHSLDFYVFRKKMRFLDYKNLNGMIAARSRYSRANEHEADRFGLEFLQKSPYKLESSLDAMERLKQSDAAFLTDVFDYSFFEDSLFKIPKESKVITYDSLVFDENFDDSKSTHPNFIKRKELLLSMLSFMPDSLERVNYYVLDSVQFNQIRELARFEVCKLNLLNLNYAYAIYHANGLLEEHQDNPFLLDVLAKAMFNLTVYAYFDPKSYQQLMLVNAEEKGPIGALITFFSHFSGPSNERKAELNVLAIQTLYQLANKYPQPLYEQMLDQLLFLLFDQNRLNPKDFYTSLEQFENDSIQTNIFTKQALMLPLNNLEFKQKFENIYEQSMANNSTAATAQQTVKITKSDKKDFGPKLAVKEMLVLRPEFLQYFRNKKKLKHLESDDGQVIFAKLLAENAKQLGISAQTIDPYLMDSTDTEQFNDFVLANDWIQDTFNHYQLGRTINIFHQDFAQLAHKYQMRYIVWFKFRATTNRGFFKNISCEQCTGACCAAAIGQGVRIKKQKDELSLLHFVYDTTLERVVSIHNYTTEKKLKQKTLNNIIKGHLLNLSSDE